MSDASRGQAAALPRLAAAERAARSLAASDDPVPAGASPLLAAASGLAKLAAAHVAHCLVADTDVRELTRKDRLALAFAPRLSADARTRPVHPDRQRLRVRASGGGDRALGPRAGRRRLAARVSRRRVTVPDSRTRSYVRAVGR